MKTEDDQSRSGQSGVVIADQRVDLRVDPVPTWKVYRAPCIAHQSGCRQCGAPIRDSRAYCSRVCRRRFEMDHFWNTARIQAIQKTKPGYDPEVYIAGGERPKGFPACAKCQKPGGLEVNHIKPLNGCRPHFGCCHHQSNLEALCHGCHVAETKRQRLAGEIGAPKAPREMPLFDSQAVA